MNRSRVGLPPLFVERLQEIIPVSRWQAVLHSFEIPKPTTFRVNTLKTQLEPAREQLASLGFQTQRVAWYREALILSSGGLRQLQQTPLYRAGGIYVQSLSSMLPPLVLQPQPGEAVLDITAAPGSKTTQLACLMRGQGRLIANDNNKVRFFKLRANLQLQGADWVETTLKHGEVLGRQMSGVFDRVLADVPCSAEGRFDVNNPTSFGFWKPLKVREMARKQKRLLVSAIQALKVGGVLVYSTCTFAPEENECVVDWAMRKFGKALALEPVALALGNATTGLSAWGSQAFDASLKLTRRILPSAEMEGFYLAKLRKRAPTDEGRFFDRGQAADVE